MTATHILSLAACAPPARYPQEDIAEFFATFIAPGRARALRTVFKRAGVGYRHFAAGADFYSRDRTTAERNDLYMAEAVRLGEQTVRRALDSAGCQPEDVDDLVIVSCTGLSVPGLDLLLAGQLGMRADLQRSCVLGMGCYGAFPGIRQAVRSRRRALMLALELCSLHLQFDDSTESVISSALFSDGAAALLVDSEAAESESPWPRILDSATHCDYTTLDHMTFTLTDHGFRMYLSSYVPDLLAAQIEPFIDGLLARGGLRRQDVAHWGVHPGSAKIVDYVQERLGLSDAQVESAHAVLREYGNMSSATILFVLEHIQRCSSPAPGDYGVLMAFGPGLTMESLLVQW